MHPSLLHDIVLGKVGPICSPEGVLLMLLQISSPRLEKRFRLQDIPEALYFRGIKLIKAKLTLTIIFPLYSTTIKNSALSCTSFNSATGSGC